VLLPTHDRPQWLAGAVRSVVDGEFKNLELIVSNNGDPQHTRVVAEEIRDSRISWVEYDQASSMLEHTLSLIDRARGKYIAILHDDDWWDSTYLAKLVPPLEDRADAVLAFCDHHDVDADGVTHPEVSSQLSAAFGRADRTQGYHKPFFDVPARQSAVITGSVIRRDALDLTDFPTEMTFVLDLWIVYLLARSGGAAFFHKELLLYRRVHADTATSAQFVAAYTGAIMCRERMLQDPHMAPYSAEIRAKLARDHRSAGAALLRQHARSDARRHILQSLRLRLDAKAVGGLVASWVAPDATLDRI
jgi:glycosyltransferase involved in cell wall biosynthesis